MFDLLQTVFDLKSALHGSSAQFRPIGVHNRLIWEIGKENAKTCTAAHPQTYSLVKLQLARKCPRIGGL